MIFIADYKNNCQFDDYHVYMLCQPYYMYVASQPTFTDGYLAMFLVNAYA